MSNLIKAKSEQCFKPKATMGGQFKLDNRYEVTRQRILDEAYRIVLHQGIDQLSMRSIATAVKSSPANLYEYFTSKDEIVCELHTKLLNDLAIYLQKVDRQLPPNEYLEQLGIAYLDFAQQHSVLFKLHGHDNVETIFPAKLPVNTGEENGHPASPDRMHPLFTVFQSAIQRQFTCAEHTSEAPCPTIHDRTMAFWSMLHGYATLMWLSVSPEYSVTAWQRLFRQFFLAA